MVDKQSEYDESYSEPRPASAVVKRCADYTRFLEKLGNRILFMTVSNVAVVILFLVFTLFSRQRLTSSYYDQDFYSFLVLALVVILSLLAMSVFTLIKFQRLSQSARIYAEEISDLLGWYRKAESAPIVTELKIALRELSARTELPLASGRQGYLAYFLLNTIVVIAFLTFMASLLINIGSKNF